MQSNEKIAALLSFFSNDSVCISVCVKSLLLIDKFNHPISNNFYIFTVLQPGQYKLGIRGKPTPACNLDHSIVHEIFSVRRRLEQWQYRLVLERWIAFVTRYYRLLSLSISSFFEVIVDSQNYSYLKKLLTKVLL